MISPSTGHSTLHLRVNIAKREGHCYTDVVVLLFRFTVRLINIDENIMRKVRGYMQSGLLQRSGIAIIGLWTVLTHTRQCSEYACT